MARFTLLFFIMLGSLVTAFGQASQSLQGTVTDETGEPLMFATVALKKGGSLITGAQTDLDGKYSFSSIDAGTYDVEVSYVGYPTKKTEGVVVYSGKSLTLNVEMTAGIDLDIEVVVTYVVPLVEQDNTTQGTTVTAEEIEKLGSKNINGIIAQAAGVSSADDGDALTIRGSRSSGTEYYIDGIRVTGGGMIPQSEIEQLQVITGGLPASIGDVVGGIVSITSKGPSRTFRGSAEIETSEFLDGYQYNLGMLSLSGPILKKKDKKGERTGQTIIGYRFSGQYRSRGDRDPSAFGVYKVKDDVYDRLTADPLVETVIGGQVNYIPAANFLTADDVELVKARPTSDDVRYDATGKFDIRLTDNMDISLGGSYNNRQSNPVSNSLMNYNRNRTDYNTDARGFFRFRHRIGGATTAADAESSASKGTSIQNASYTLQFSYNRSNRLREDPIHQGNLFNYGYIGVFDHQRAINRAGTSYSTNLINYIPSDINGDLTNYNKAQNATALDFGYDNLAIESFPLFNGSYSTAFTRVHSLHDNVNRVFDLADKRENHLYQFNAKGLFEVVPKGDNKGKHTIEFGLMYEQRTERSYSINPTQLWINARQLANSHFDGLDTLDIIGTNPTTGAPIFAELAKDGTWANDDPDNRTDQQSYFDNQLRAALNAGRKEWIDVDALTPDQLKLSYFSATELTNTRLVDYSGYDYLGNELDGTVSFNDFFLEKDANGEYTRKVAPNQPIYTAAYIEDKFLFKDIIFRVGLRVDRYDANTKALRDNYVIGDFLTASEVGGTIPGTVSGDAVAYTIDGSNNPDKIIAYRDGNIWYTADGTEKNSPIDIFGSTQAVPAGGKDTKIQSADFDPNTTFVDAEPTITWMPRLSFSFPISEDANFFAHYDVLTQRPLAYSLATPLDYYYFADNTRDPNFRFNNPSLRPEKTIDYEVGFQQKLSDKSAIKMSAYYKELRDMIQSQTYLYAYPSTYDGYGNQDFGTVKGFNFTYDLRRTNNLSLKVSYTLQFAEGTGSDADSQADISNDNTGNLRVIYPMSFDERHRVTATADYRYSSGNTYNGPTIGGRQIFANMGLNITASSASGRPYTSTSIPTVLDGTNTKGSLNGSRLPWSSTVNLRIDKDITLVEQTKEKKGMYLNVYFRVQNLLDQRNIVNVYTATGSPDDDGYLASAIGQSVINGFSDDNFRNGYLMSYQWRVLNPDFYSIPRRIYVGASVNF